MWSNFILRSQQRIPVLKLLRHGTSLVCYPHYCGSHGTISGAVVKRQHWKTIWYTTRWDPWDSTLNVNENRIEEFMMRVWDWWIRELGNGLVGRVSTVSQQSWPPWISVSLCMQRGLLSQVFWLPRFWFRGRRKEVDQTIPTSRGLVGRLDKGLRDLVIVMEGRQYHAQRGP